MDYRKWFSALALAVLGWSVHVSVATTPNCVDYEKLRDIKSLEGVLPLPTIAFQGEVVAVDPNPADTTAALPQLTPPPARFQQKVTFRVIKTLKGSYQVGDVVHLTVPVTTICAGSGCVFPFKIGDVTFVLAPSSAPSFIEGCWMYEGVAMRRILSVPAFPSPQSPTTSRK